MRFHDYLGSNVRRNTVGQLQHCAPRRAGSHDLLCSARDRGTRRQRFDAAALAASAQRTVVINADMASFRGSTGAAMMNPAVEDDSAADARANRHVENETVSACCSPQRLG